MGTVYIRQHTDLAGRRFGGSASGVVKGELVTPATEVTTSTEAAVDMPALTSKTHFVAIEPIDCNIRYVVRPKARRYTPLAATAKDTPIPAGAVVYEAVYPGAIISLLQVAMPPGTPAYGSGVFLPAYVPVLAL